MVSFKLLLVSVAALASATSASYGHQNMHHRMINRRATDGYGYNDTISTPTGTGTGVPDYTVEPTTFMTESTKYITVTYTLGNGRAVTKTITKTVEYEKTAYETHRAPINTLDKETTTVYQDVAPTFAPVVPTFVPVVPEFGKTTRTCTTTVSVTIPYEEPTYGESSAPAIAPEEAHGTVTVTKYTTTTTVVVTSTVIPASPVVSSVHARPPYGNSTISKYTPYGNFTVSKYFEDDKTTTTTLYTTSTITTTIPHGPTGSGGLSYYK